MNSKARKPAKNHPWGIYAPGRLAATGERVMQLKHVGGHKDLSGQDKVMIARRIANMRSGT